jgi:L-ribulokinase
MKKYSIGIDFGTLSARALIADVENGEILPAVYSFEYPHAVMSELGGAELPKNYALQHPRDYIDALDALIPKLVADNKVAPEQIVGIGIDFTACTFLPLDKDGVPLCFDEKFEKDPHAYAKLWKHTGADKYADRIEAIAADFGDMLKITGGILSSEFMCPKLYETYIESPEVYKNTAKFINAGDFIASILTGRYVRSLAYATIKEHYDNTSGAGFPPREFYERIDPGFADVLDKLGREIDKVGDSAGSISPEWAKRLGLCEDTQIAVPIIDAHGAFGAAGIEDGRVVAALGTSAVIAALSSDKKYVPGIHSHGYGATAPGLMTFEAGIRAMGDLYAWFTKNCVPAEYERLAKEAGLSIHAYLRSLAEKKEIGESGLIALDWWSGNRSIIPNDKLSGMIVGLTLSTRPEDIYRAIIEATVFELRRVCENYSEHGVKINSFVATGGIANKDPMLMQILSDVLGMEVGCLGSSEATALGSAVWGAVAAGCYTTLEEASAKMKLPISKTYYPNVARVEAYEKLYRRYVELYDYFARENKVMEFLYNNKHN